MTDRTVRTTAADAPTHDLATDAETVWLVERKHPAGTPRRLVLVYATTDGTRYVQTERRVTGRAGTGAPAVPVAESVDPEALDPVEDPETRARFAAEAQRLAALHDPAAPR